MAMRKSSIVIYTTSCPRCERCYLIFRNIGKSERAAYRLSGATDNCPAQRVISARPDSVPVWSRRLEFDASPEQILDPLKVRIGILQCPYSVDGVHNPDAAVALSRAVNDWQIDEC
jgi:anti-sigma factor RsiW